MTTSSPTFTAFSGHRLIARGSIDRVLRAAKARVDQDDPIALFDDQTGSPIDVDYRGTIDEVLDRLADHPFLSPREDEPSAPPRRGPGRPKLGVVSGEVTLLPRHWEWLKSQRGGASAALRRLVEEARRRNQAADRARTAKEALGRFLWQLAGDLPGFEEASRAFYASDYERFLSQAAPWPEDLRAYVRDRVDELRPLEAAAAVAASDGAGAPA